MKTKGEKIALVVAIILIIAFITAAIFGIKALVKHVKVLKDELSINEFTSIMKDNDFDVADVTTQFADADIKVKEARVARKGDYQIEFYTFDESDDAELFYRVNKAKFGDDIVNTRVDLKGGNYESYGITTKDKYQFIIRVEKSVVYVNVDKEYKKDAQDIVKKLGY